jgi:hypothetical protein
MDSMNTVHDSRNFDNYSKREGGLQTRSPANKTLRENEDKVSAISYKIEKVEKYNGQVESHKYIYSDQTTRQLMADHNGA